MNAMATINSATPSSGVCGHSMPGRFDSWAIFCVGNDPYREAAFTTWANATGLRFKSLLGSYKGQQERSFLVSLEDFYEHIERSEWIKDQESVLILEPRRKPDGTVLKTHNAPIDAFLYYTDGRPDGDIWEPLGEFIETHQARAQQQEGWTYDPMFGTWFIVI